MLGVTRAPPEWRAGPRGLGHGVASALDVAREEDARHARGMPGLAVVDRDERAGLVAQAGARFGRARQLDDDAGYGVHVVEDEADDLADGARPERLQCPGDASR